MNRLRLLRYERGHSVAEVVAGTGISKSTLLRWEREDAPSPTAGPAKSLADFYKITVAELLDVEREAA